MNRFQFFLLNFLISSNLLFKISLLFLIYIIISIYPFKYDGEPFGLAIWIALFFVLFVWIFKILIFILLSQVKRKDTYMGQFFERIKNNCKYKFKVILYALLCDFLCLFIIPTCLCIIKKTAVVDLLFFDILGSVFWGGGITLSYVSLILWFKIKEKLSKNCG